MNRKELKTLIFLMLIALAIYFGIDIYIPSLPWIQQSLDVSKTVVQLTIALYTLGAAMSVLLAGPLSDKHGRKPIIIAGLITLLIGSLLAVFAVNGSLLLSGRLIQGIGAGCCMGANRAMLTDTFIGKRLVSVGSYFSTFIAISPIVAPIIGGYLEQAFSWRANFVVLAVYYGLLLITFGLFADESIREKHKEQFSLRFLWQRYNYLVRQADFRTYAACAGLVLGVPIAYATTGPFILQKTLHLSPILFGWMGIFIGMGTVFGKLLNPQLVKCFGIHKTFVIGLALITLGGLALTSVYSLGYLSVTLVVGITIIALFGQSFSSGNAFVLGLSGYRHMGGAANALVTASQMGFSFVIGTMLSALSHHFPETYSLSGSFLLIGIVSLFLFGHYSRSTLNKKREFTSQ